MLASVLPVLAVLVRPRALPLVAARTCVPLMVRACASTSSPSALDSWLDGALSAERRKRASLVKEAEAARSAERLSAWATLVVANLYRIDDTATSVIVEDWENEGQPTELRFDPDAGTPRQQADAAFVKARRLRRGSAVVAELIKESEARESRLGVWRERSAAAGGDVDADAALEQTILSEIMRDAKKLKLKLKGLLDEGSDGKRRKATRDQSPPPIAPSNTPGWAGREFTSPAGVPILVGRNRKENEQLSLAIARPPDVWMHVRGSPGAHVILQMSRMKGRPAPEDDCLQMAADLAAFYSEMRDEGKVLVTYANPKHVTKPNGAPLGAVKLREEGGTLLGRPSDSAFLPPELKQQREREKFGGSSSPVMSGGGAKKWT